MHRKPRPPLLDGKSEGGSLLQELARRVRRLRDEQGYSRIELARRAGLSVRFLARVESGEGNISVLRLQSLAEALDTTADALVRWPRGPSRIIALVGLRGAGKSSVGPELARRLGLAFIEMDTRITEVSGLPLDQLFELHGERYYRRLERETLRRILESGEAAVLAAAGGVVNEPGTWEMLCRRSTVVWLRALPEDHWRRVIAQGDRRPMADNPGAMDELRAILRDREATYSEADLTIDTTEHTPSEVAGLIVEQLADAPGGRVVSKDAVTTRTTTRAQEN